MAKPIAVHNILKEGNMTEQKRPACHIPTVQVLLMVLCAAQKDPKPRSECLSSYQLLQRGEHGHFYLEA